MQCSQRTSLYIMNIWTSPATPVCDKERPSQAMITPWNPTISNPRWQQLWGLRMSLLPPGLMERRWGGSHQAYRPVSLLNAKG